MRYVKRHPLSLALLRSASGGAVLASILLVIPGCGSDATQNTTGNGWPTTPPPDPYDAGSGGAGTDGPGSGGSGAMPTNDSGSSDRSATPDVSTPPPPPPPTDAGPSDSLGPRIDASGDATGPGDGGSPTSFSWRDGIIYYVFADRFADANPQNNCVVPGVSPSEVGEPISPAQYQGGDWAGVTAKINEGFFKSLGVNAIMITSPMTNTMTAGQGIDGDSHFYSAYHGYWPTRVDPQTPSACYGTPADLAAMVSTAHAQGLKVLFDHTIVHVHASSDIYVQHANWFWTNAGQPWCLCGTTGCDWDPFTGQGLRCWFANYLPHWNYTVPEARDFAVKMTVDWLNYYGIDGLRLDAIKHVDESWLLATRTAVTNEVSSRRPGNPLYLVGETVDGNTATLARFVDPATRLDGQFDFPTRAEIVRIVLRRAGQMQDLATWMDQHANDYGPNAVMSTMLGTHDMQRVIHHAENVPVGVNEWEDGRGPAPRTGGWTNHPAQPSTAEAYERLANGFAVMFTNKGAPLVYYGDEIGLAGAGDPDNRRMMPWTGLSAPQQALRDRVTALIKVRNEHPATRSGTRTTVVANANVWAYTLSYTSGLISDRIHVVINRGDAPATVMLPTGNLTELLVGGTALGPSVTVPARQTRIYQP